MLTPAEISVNSVCYACIPDKWAALLYLLDQIVSAGGTASELVTCGAGAPVTAPTGGCGIYLDRDTDALYIYTNGAWSLKV